MGIFDEYAIEDNVVKKLHSISDEGANVRAALKTTGKSIICICHLLNTIVKRSIDLYKKRLPIIDSLSDQDKDEIDKAKQLIACSKVIERNLRWFQNCILIYAVMILIFCSNTLVEDQFESKIKLIREGETRWLSKLYLLQSVSKNIEDLTILRRKEELGRYFTTDVRSAINFIHENFNDLLALIKFLKVFEAGIICFQAKKPLIYAVWPYILKLKVSFA